MQAAGNVITLQVHESTAKQRGPREEKATKGNPMSIKCGTYDQDGTRTIPRQRTILLEKGEVVIIWDFSYRGIPEATEAQVDSKAIGSKYD